MTDSNTDLVFAPLGGLGEIGMNAALYGFGPKGRRKWLMVDLGVAFAGPELPGIDLILPDLAFIERNRKDLVGLVITHAHEDHIGAVARLWPRIGCPLYATRFAAGLLEVRRLGEDGAPKVPIHIVAPGVRIDLAPFSVEMIPVAHSIPESTALAIRTPLGTVLHSGDWKIDPTPVAGWATDEARLRAIGDEGVLALISDSTNILRDGESPSEADVAANLENLIADAPNRVLVTTFASNVARMRAVALAAARAGRHVVVAGRAMDRVSEVARECGYLDGVPDFLPAESFANLPRNKIVIMATGSQGEGRAAMARIANDDHPQVHLASGDRVIFSSRPIPGNERAINDIINGLVRQGIEVITDRTDLVHVSGHPRRSEVKHLYEWIRPRIAIPAHGEALHLSEHARFARAQGVAETLVVNNGDLVHLAPGVAGIIDQVDHGRLYTDGDLIVPSDDEALRERRGLSFAGIISVGVAMTAKGELAGDPDVVISGIPQRTRDGRAMDAIIDKAVFEVLEGLPRARRRDPDAVESAVERAVRSAVRAVWGKRPTVHVLVMEV
ncbi:ribonuclease J [Methylocella sp. CPCC 101449]|uniref:ribonuclease J n=1 Tax=Methylocella sp. CPCC 101449 TaxID=2987531 RepID=UPI00288CB71E|nr:ribonuclease J [Methylocella sp. CPCC 101449]MDT2024522.1 ribonuclease J [Methylocella sp. CPCC 101449]